MPLPKLSSIINKLFATAKIPQARIDALSRLNPQRIYIENVRSILGVNATEAIKLCENAYHQGLFGKGIEVRCPDGAVAIAADAENAIPQTVHCWVEEDGHLEEKEVLTRDLERVSFYVLR
jgi:hypothetical protein